MATVRKMLDSHPDAKRQDTSRLGECAEACFTCAQTCTACADACLGEPQVDQLVQCIRLNLDCADICITAGRTILRLSNGQSEAITQLMQSCMSICRECGAECEQHAQEHDHCRVCAEECRNCERACEQMLKQLSASV